MVSKVLSRRYKTVLREVKTLVFRSKLSFVKLLQIEHSLIFLYWAIKKSIDDIQGSYTLDSKGHFLPLLVMHRDFQFTPTFKK